MPSIREQAKNNDEAKKYVRFVQDGVVELISPNSKGVVRINKCKVPVASSDLRLEELKHIDQTISNLNELPDFGYEEGNFVTEDDHITRNWRLITHYIFNQDKYQKVSHHVKLRAAQREVDRGNVNKNKKAFSLKPQQKPLHSIPANVER